MIWFKGFSIPSLHQRVYQLAEPLWTDSGLKSGISVRELISTLKKKKKSAGVEWMVEVSQNPRKREEKKKATIISSYFFFFSFLCLLIAYMVMSISELKEILCRFVKSVQA